MSTAEELDKARDATASFRVSLVRLVSAIGASLIASLFLAAYTHQSHHRFQFEHPGRVLIRFNETLIAFSGWALAVPFTALCLGMLLLLMRPKSVVMFELLISLVWITSLLMIAVPVLTWQMQNAPTFSHMEWHL